MVYIKSEAEKNDKHVEGIASAWPWEQDLKYSWIKTVVNN